MLCCLLLLTSFEIAISVRRDVHSGNAFILFSKTDVENNDKEVSLYINESTLIGTWTWKNGLVEVRTNPDYTGRIDMDINKNIWIFEVDVKDTGKYCIKCNRTDRGIEVELNVLGKFTEEEIKNGLDDHPQFEKYFGNLTDEVRKEITKWLKDHPGFIEKLFESSRLRSDYIMIIIFVIVTIQLVKSLFCRKFSAMSRALKGTFINYGASGDACVTFFENKERTGGREVKDRNYDPGSSKAIIRSKDHSAMTVPDVGMFSRFSPSPLLARKKADIGSIHPKVHQQITFIIVEMAILVILMSIMFTILQNAKGHYKRSKNTLTEDEIQEWLCDHPDFMEKHLGISCDTTTNTNQKDDTEGTSQSLIIATMAVLVTVITSFIWRARESGERKILQIPKYSCIQCEKRLQKKKESKRRGERTSEGKQQWKQRVSDVDKPNLSLKWRFSGRTRDSEDKPWLLDLILNPDDDLIVTDGQNKDLKKFSLEGKLKYRLPFETRPDCLALTDGYNVAVTFPFENKLRVVNTKADLFIVSVIEFKFQCTGISSMKDGRLIIGNRESKSVFLCSRDGKIQQEIKTGNSGETLFNKPSYIRVVNNRAIYVSDYRAKEFFIININDDNTFTISKHQISYPCTSCVVDDMLFVAASNIRIYTLDGNAAGNLNLDGVQHVRGLAFSEDKRLLIATHKSDAEDKISVYEVMKSSERPSSFSWIKKIT